MKIRRESSEDVRAVQRVNLAAFGRADEANLVDALRERGAVIASLVAVESDQVVGHILFSPASVANSSLRIAGLGPMSVLPERQRAGVGSSLVRTGLEVCRREGLEALVVVGHPNYYPRFGFAPASRFGLTCEYDVPDEFFMAMELKQSALQDVGGLVRYQPEFSEV